MSELEPTRTYSNLTATEELLALLKEHGVEHYEHEAPAADCVAFFDGKHWHDCWDSVGEEINVTFSMTPEQAIAATLGRGSCQQEEYGWSTEGDHARVWLTCGHDCMVETVADLPNYCPICGAEVMHA